MKTIKVVLINGTSLSLNCKEDGGNCMDYDFTIPFNMIGKDHDIKINPKNILYIETQKEAKEQK